MNKVRVGVIGIGNMGSAHARSIFTGNISGMELAAVCDTDQNKLRWAEKNLGQTPRFDDYKKLFESGLIDAVIIATPHYLHPLIAMDAFACGLHVLTEKPAGVYTGQVSQMNAAAEKSGKVFGIMYNQRTNPLYAKARQMVQGGELGELKRCVWIITNWYRTQAYYDSGSWRATWAGEGGGVLLNQCPHNLDLWQWIFGMPAKIRGFCGFGKYHRIEVDDDVTAYAEYENGATGVFITTTGECPGTNRLEISGDKGKLVIEDGKLKFWNLLTPEREFCFSTRTGFDIPDMLYSETSCATEGTAHNGILQNFANAVLHGETLLTPGLEGINGVAISNAILLSSWTDGWVTLPVDEKLYFAKLKEKIDASNIKEGVSSEIANLTGTYNQRWEVKW